MELEERVRTQDILPLGASNTIVIGSDDYILYQQRDLKEIPFPGRLNTIGGMHEKEQHIDPYANGFRELLEEVFTENNETLIIDYANHQETISRKEVEQSFHQVGVYVLPLPTTKSTGSLNLPEHPIFEDIEALPHNCNNLLNKHVVQWYFAVQLPIPVKGAQLKEGTGVAFHKDTIGFPRPFMLFADEIVDSYLTTKPSQFTSAINLEQLSGIIELPEAFSHYRTTNTYIPELSGVLHDSGLRVQDGRDYTA